MLLCECKAKNTHTTEKQIKCFLLKTEIWKRKFTEFYGSMPEYLVPEFVLWYVSLRGFTRNAKKLMNQRKIASFDHEKLNRELKKANILTIPRRFIEETEN